MGAILDPHADGIKDYATRNHQESVQNTRKKPSGNFPNGLKISSDPRLGREDRLNFLFDDFFFLSARERDLFHEQRLRLVEHLPLAEGEVL